MRFTKKIVILITVALCCMAVGVYILATARNNRDNTDIGNPDDMPVVNIHHEPVAVISGNQIYRMVVSASAPNGFMLFGIVMSYINTVIIPVHHEAHDDIEVPMGHQLQPLASSPFSLLAYGFTQVPDIWLTQGNRAGFSYDVFTLEQGAGPDEFTAVFAFYYRVIDNHAYDNATFFRIEDGRNAESLVGVDATAYFVRPGVHIQSGTSVYIWGPHIPDHNSTEIPDINITK